MTDPAQAPPTNKTRCGLCGRNPAAGYAGISVTTATGYMTMRLCHGDEDSPMTCYHRWTVYGERPDD